MPNDLDTSFKLRLPSELLRQFIGACDDNDQSAAQVIRASMREYIDANAKKQGDLLKPTRSKAR